MASLIQSQYFSGVQSLAAGGTSFAIPLGATVDPTKCMVLLSVGTTRRSTIVPNVTLCGYTLTSTTLTLLRGVTDSVACNVSWQVIEFSSGLTVQHGSFTPSSGANTVTISSAAVAYSAVMVNGFVCTSNSTYAEYGYIEARSSATNFIWHCGGAQTGDVVYYQVWTFDSDAITSLQQKVFSDVYTTSTATISAVDLSHTLIFGNAYPGSTGGGTRGESRWDFNSTTQIKCYPYLGTGSKSTTPATAWVIEIPNITVDRGTLTFAATDTALTYTMASNKYAPFYGFVGSNASWGDTAHAPGSTSYQSTYFNQSASSTTLTVDRVSASAYGSITAAYQAVLWATTPPGTLAVDDMYGTAWMDEPTGTQSGTIYADDMYAMATMDRAYGIELSPASAIRAVLEGMAENSWLRIDGFSAGAATLQDAQLPRSPSTNFSADGTSIPVSTVAGVGAYSGGTYIDEIDHFMVWGGGHTDTGDSSVYAVDVEDLCHAYLNSTTPVGWTLKWKSVRYQSTEDTSFPLPPTFSGYYPTTNVDGLYGPQASHSYNNVNYSPYLGIVLAGGTYNFYNAAGGSGGLWILNPRTWTWSLYDASAGAGSNNWSSWCEPIRRVVANQSNGYLYDMEAPGPSASSRKEFTSLFTVPNTFTNHFYIDKPGALDQKVLWSPDITDYTQAYIVPNFDPVNVVAHDRQVLTYATAAPSWVNGTNSGFIQRPSGTNTQIYTTDGTDIALFDVATNAWSTLTTATGDVPGAYDASGTFGKFHYIAAHDAFIYVVDATNGYKIYIYKPAGWSPMALATGTVYSVAAWARGSNQILGALTP